MFFFSTVSFSAELAEKDKAISSVESQCLNLELEKYIIPMNHILD